MPTASTITPATSVGSLDSASTVIVKPATAVNDLTSGS